jgi:hypothetical protein
MMDLMLPHFAVADDDDNYDDSIEDAIDSFD